MKRFLCLLALAASLLVQGTVPTHAQTSTTALGQAAASFPLLASKVVADPVRPRVYAADLVNNSVAVIDTTTLRVIANVPTGGLYPIDLAVSLDAASLYVANGGSITQAITTIDLATLKVRATFPLQGFTPLAVAAGPAGRFFATGVGSNTSSSAFQLDDTTGTIQATFDVGFAGFARALQLGAGGLTLFVASGYTSGSDAGLDNLRSYNVTGAIPGIMQTVNAASIGGEQLVVSNTGQYVCLPGTGGNFANMGVSTTVFSVANLNTLLGAFNNTTRPGPLAFSPDDTLVYQARFATGTGNLLDVFSAQSFARLNEVTLPGLTAGTPGSSVVNGVALDRTGSYLFVAESSQAIPVGATTTFPAGQLVVVETGTGTLSPAVAPVITSTATASATVGTAFSFALTASNTPTSFAAVGLPGGLGVDTTTGLISGTPTVAGTFPVAVTASNTAGQGTATLTITVADVVPVVPAVGLTATVPTVQAGSGGTATVQVTRTGGDVAGKLVVLYSVGGTAQNGVDYTTLTGRVKIKPGATTAVINVVPTSTLSGGTSRNVKLKLLPGAGYTFGGVTAKAKVSILP